MPLDEGATIPPPKTPKPGPEDLVSDMAEVQNQSAEQLEALQAARTKKRQFLYQVWLKATGKPLSKSRSVQSNARRNLRIGPADA
jgi:hypothetical protein